MVRTPDTLDTRPYNCRARLRDENKAYPRSGCESCKTTIITGLSCPYEHKNDG